MISEGLGTLLGSGLDVVGSIAGGLMSGNAEEAAYKRRKQAYDEMIQRATNAQNAGETAFNNVVDNQNTYLNQVGQDLKDQTNEQLNAGANQLNASLAQQGVRGGQAATQLARGIGNMTTQANRDLNQMNYQDLAQRNNLKATYNMAKAQAGLNAGLQQFQG